jgi:hypothetical protein
MRRGRQWTVCARGADLAPSHGRSTSPLAAVRRILLLLLCAVATIATAQGKTVTLSKYNLALKLMSFDAARSTAQFSGTIEVTGTLVVEFDMDAPGRANGEVNFARFFPDAESLHRLPAVVAGYYAAPIRYVSLEPAPTALEAGFGRTEAARLSHGSEAP